MPSMLHRPVVVAREPPAGVRLRIFLLGAPRLQRPDGALHLLERKDAALLALLAQEGPQQHATACRLLWADVGDPQARANLRQRLFRLRRTAQREIVLSRGLLRLADDVDVDLAAAPERLAEDAGAAQGPLLGSYDYGDSEPLERWAAAARARWRSARLERLAQLASEHEARGRIAAALAYAQRLVDEDPLQEHACRRLMRLHHLRGDRAAALAAYEGLAALLQRELGEPPGAETRELVTVIARGVEAPAPVPRPVPAALRRPPRLVGREAAWQALEGAERDRRPALVAADAGVGKSRLLQEAVERSAAPGAFGLLAGRPGDAGAPYALAARLLETLHARFGAPALGPAQRALLARLAPTLGTPDAGALEPAALRVSLEQALAAWRTAGLAGLVLDDLHFADGASLELLLPLAGPSAAAGLRWLMAARPRQGPRTLQDRLADAAGAGWVVVRLQPLDGERLRQLLASLELAQLDPAAWAPRLLAHTGGIPLLVLATLSELHALRPQGYGAPPERMPAPSALDALLRERLRLLTPAALQLAQVAAIAQQDFDAELAAAVLECSVPALVAPWRELEDANVFAGEPFSHELVRESVAADVPRPVARALHRRIAHALQAAGAPPARVASHWSACEEWARAARAFEQGAAEALRLSRRPEELGLLQRAAAAHARAGDGRAAFDCRWRAVHVMRVSAEVQQALAAAHALVGEAAGAGQRLRALEARAAVYNDMAEAALALADVAAARADGIEPASAMQVRLAQREAMALLRENRNAEGLAVLAAVRPLALALEDDTERLAWRCDHATALDYNDRLEDAVEAFREIAADAEAAGRHTEAGEALGNLAITLVYLGRVSESRRCSERVIELGHRHVGSAGGVLIDEMTLAGTLRDLGRFGAALALGHRVADAMQAAGHTHWAVNTQNDLAVTYHWLGRADLALKALRPLPGRLPDGVRGIRLLTLARLGLVPARAAAEAVERAARLLAGVGRSYVRLRVALERARHAEPGEAAARAADVEQQACALQQVAIAGQALELQVDALRRLGDAARAAATAQRLLEHLRRFEVVASYPALPWWAAAQALAAEDPAAARQARERARAWLHDEALPHVPPAYHECFLSRNPVNAALMRGALGAPI